MKSRFNIKTENQHKVYDAPILCSSAQKIPCPVRKKVIAYAS
jgi:hypothetical protein